MKWLGLILLFVFCAGRAETVSGRVIDAQSGAPIADAIVTYAGKARPADDEGRFSLDGESALLGARAPGYRRAQVAAAGGDIRLEPFTPHALYLSVYGIGSAKLRGAALDLIAGSRLNALVIDMKGDRGLVPYRSALPLATEIGAQKVITIRDLPGLLRMLHERGLYAIARVVVFKDDLLVAAHPELAVRLKDGGVYRDREGQRWIDPARSIAWDYAIGVAEEAAAAGFDEIQFDYVRFADSPGIRRPPPDTETSRTATIDAFLDEARARLAPYNVFLAADVFGYICWNLDDTHIGQKLEELIRRVDYLSPMLYPSGFQFGIPGTKNPITDVEAIVRLSLERARERTRDSPRKLRPWLQAFKDYAFDRSAFGLDRIGLQIGAADKFGADGWMIWNPRNVYIPGKY